MSLKNVVCLALLFAMMFCLSACTDYEGVVDDKYEEWKASIDDIPNSSSNVVLSSSSSVILNDSEGSSSSFEASWTYLNPDIDYGEITDTRDNQVYKTVTIGTQTWMAQNLNYAYTGVKYGYNGYYTSDSTSWCYDNKASNCATYGRLYTWAAAVDSVAIYQNYGEECGYGKSCKRFSATALATAPVRGVCPSGWHLPSNAEWSTLYTNVGGSGTAGSLLKSTSGWNNGGNGTDKYGFSVLPAGYRSNDGNFYDLGDNASFWSSTEYENGSYDAWYQYFFYGDDVHQGYDDEDYGFSVRCLKDSI